MGIFDTIFNIVLYRPLGFLLSLAYAIVPNYGIALLIFSIFIRLILFPTNISTQKGLAKNARMQAKVEKIKKKYATNKQRQQEEINNLYQREGFNPLSGGCLPTLIQFPIILALYQVVYRPFTYIAYAPSSVIDAAKTALQALNIDGVANMLKSSTQAELAIFRYYDSIKDSVPELAQYYDRLGDRFFNFLGLDLSVTPNIGEINVIWLIPILAGLTSLLLGVLQMMKQKKQNPEATKSMGCVTYTMPLISIIFAFSMPAAVGFYWTCSNVAMLLQNYITNKLFPPEDMLGKLLITETIERRSKEKMRKLRIKASD